MTLLKSLIGATSTAALTLAVALPSVAQEDNQTRRAIARLADKDGTPVGAVEFTAAPGGVLVDVVITELTPGEHAIHLHETGSCSPSFDAAGEHFAPDGKKHGFLNENGPHAGDLPNIFVDVNRAAAAHFFNDRVMLDGVEGSLMGGDGTAVIVHELSDLYGNQAGAGRRLACGVLEHRI